MLEELRLRGLGAIDEAVLELSPGFTAITGETGAGKTMLLSGLGLLFGGRADAALVRAGHRRAEVDGRVRVDPDGPAARRAADAGAELDGDALLLARTVSAEGRSRAFVGGRGVPVGVLADLADDLVTVHGQADQRGLLRPGVQRAVLDRYAGSSAADALSRYQSLFDRAADVRARLRDVTTRRRERAQEADLLRFGLAEIETVAPTAGEELTLRAEIDRLAHADLLRHAAEAAHAVLNAGEDGDADADVLTMLGAARRSLEDVRARDPALDPLAGRLAEAAYLLSDVAADLRGYADGVDADPARLEHAQHRLAAVGGLLRKYGEDTPAVLAWAEQARARLLELDDDDERVATLTAEHEGLVADLGGAAAELSALRRSAAGRLEVEVGTELEALAMPQARLQVAVRDRPDEAGLMVGDRRVAFGRFGVDEVELLLTAHAGAPPRPLDRGASGGELSRVMLALEVVLAGSDPVPTFVFDEVDAGIGGMAAVEVGRRLARLARTAQVVVVTHLPQVAAFADHHVVVRKTGDGTVTSTDVRAVAGAQRLEELSRMLGGLADSALGRGHAEELLAVAAAAKHEI